jgi:rubrerythrin
MLTAQCDGLRETADEVERIKHNNADWLWRDGITLVDAARELRDAADTIENLRNRLTETCHDVGLAPYFFECSECGKTHLRNAAYVDMPNYCPECGRKVVG